MQLTIEVLLVALVLATLQLGLAQECQSNVPTSCVEVRNSDPDGSSGYYWIRTGSSQVQHFCDYDTVGLSQNNPAASCSEVKERHPNISSGDYWVENSLGQTIQMYCNMELTCGNVTGGWMRVADIDMRNASDSCPSGLNETTINSTRVCSMNIPGAGCSFATIPTYNVQYSHVCGKIIGYQDGTPDAFQASNLSSTINDLYVDGISLTHGESPARNHIWTFAAAHDETESTGNLVCPCTNASNPITISIPSFVGSNYFCETGSVSLASVNAFYSDDPLWDGEGCGPDSTCCSFNNPPWFSKQLPSPTTNDIEMRLCLDETRSNEDITFEQVELYVQ